MTLTTAREAAAPRFDAAVFDMDGLLIDSEPLWRRAERLVFAGVGLELSDDQCKQTTGLRIDEVVGFWFGTHPWREPARAVVEARIVETVVDLIRAEGAAMPGVEDALALCERRGLLLGLASSSSPAIIDAVLQRLGLGGRFRVAHSAVHEKRGKPYPDVYNATCARLGVPPAACVAFEDSLNGVKSARSAGMRCIAVTGRGEGDSAAIAAAADVVLPSLEDLRDVHLVRRCC